MTAGTLRHYTSGADSTNAWLLVATLGYFSESCRMNDLCSALLHGHMPLMPQLAAYPRSPHTTLAPLPLCKGRSWNTKATRKHAEALVTKATYSLRYMTMSGGMSTMALAKLCSRSNGECGPSPSSLSVVTEPHDFRAVGEGGANSGRVT